MDAQHKLKSLLDQLNTVIVGKSAQIQDCVACMLAGGHLMIDDVPGVGKTTLAQVPNSVTVCEVNRPASPVKYVQAAINSGVHCQHADSSTNA